jgi:hypothetical protein
MIDIHFLVLDDIVRQVMEIAECQPDIIDFKFNRCSVKANSDVWSVVVDSYVRADFSFYRKQKNLYNVRKAIVLVSDTRIEVRLFHDHYSYKIFCICDPGSVDAVVFSVTRFIVDDVGF